MNNRTEIEIPAPLTDAILQFSAEQELTVEENVETAMRIYMEGRLDNGR